jgi:hypothetical protein
MSTRKRLPPIEVPWILRSQKIEAVQFDFHAKRNHADDRRGAAGAQHWNACSAVALVPSASNE